jgi:hypothetical protein
MKLIDRYVNKVGEILPDNIRQDIENEIRSLIECRLMDRCEEEGITKPTETLVKEVLIEMGPPEMKARVFLPKARFIAPSYSLVFKGIIS